MSEKFLVLANSKKKIAERSSGDTGRCIAGIRIKDNGDCEWLRPVDPNTETGAIPIREADKYPLFSLVDLDILGEDNHKETYQYENKIVKLGTQKSKLPKEKFLKILKNFKQESGNTILGVFPRDRISVEKQGYITGSLKIVAPKYIEFYKQDSSNGKPQIRCKFSFDNNSWRDIVVTDGYFINEYGYRLSYINNLKEQIYVVTSLGLPFNGYIYLLAACIFFLKDEYFLEEINNNYLEGDFSSLKYTHAKSIKEQDKQITKNLKVVEPEKSMSIEELRKEFFRLKDMGDALGEAQSQVKNVEVAYNSETGEIRYKIGGKYYSKKDIVNLDGYIFLKKDIKIGEFNGKKLVKYGDKLYYPKDIEGDGCYYVRNGTIPVAYKVGSGYYNKKDLVSDHFGFYILKKDAIKVEHNGKIYYFGKDDDYSQQMYLKKDLNGNWRLKFLYKIIEEKNGRWRVDERDPGVIFLLIGFIAAIIIVIRML